MVAGAIADLRRDRLAALRSLLRANGLPDDDCENSAIYFCGVFDGDDLVAAGGLGFRDAVGLVQPGAHLRMRRRG